ncbi:MAG: hypothetical protein M3Y66_06705 [Actinomycetota bacterium]|nr:hypothetical protein [Actinomycetota bacterium]
MAGTDCARQRRLPWLGLGVGVALVAVAMLVPALTGWDVYAGTVPPLNADWAPRVGPGTLTALVIAFLATWRAREVTQRASWRTLLVWSFVAALAWLLALAVVDGLDGIQRVLDTPNEYLHTARSLHDFGGALPDWVSRITLVRAPDNWPVHVAGHPPGATMFFWVLVQLGLGSGLNAGLVVTFVAATTPLAVLTAMRALGAEMHARWAAPFLVFGPSAVWSAVSADAVFTTVTSWGIALLALAATRERWTGRVGWSVPAGLFLGCAVMMSYGLPLIGLLSVAVLWLAKSWRTLPITALVAFAVVLGFAAYGFYYWDALPALHTRYYEGIASRRPASYWMWGNVAALVISAGPAMAAGVASVLGQARGLLHEQSTRVVTALSLGGVAMVLAADLSQLSRAEVERIWLPFVPWLLVSCALLTPRWRAWGLAAQVVTALLVQHLLKTGW